MTPGIMFLAGNQPAIPAAAEDSTEARNGEANRPPPEDGEQPSSVSPPQMRTAHAASNDNKKEPSRSDSPGYFTLSDSDGASNPGTESPQEDEVKAGGLKTQGQRRRPQQPEHQRQSQKRHQVYKMFKSPSRPLSASAATSSGTGKPISTTRPSSDGEKSKTPPRPSPPKGYSRRDSWGSDRDRGLTPPRPPPPLSYTSTLPPPVPKKTRPKTPTKMPNSGAKTVNRQQQQQQQHFKTIPAVRRSSASSSNRKSSPAGVATGRSSSTLPRVQPLQMQSPSMIKALTKSVSAKSEATPPLPPKERKSPTKEKTHPTPKKPKTFVQAFQSANSGGNDGNNRASPPRGKGPSITPRPTKTSTARASSSCSRTSPGMDELPQPPRSPSEPGTSSRRSSVASTKSSAEVLKKAVMKTLQVNGRQESKGDNKGAPASVVGIPLSGKGAKNSFGKIGSEMTASKSPSPRRSSKSLSATAIEKIRERRNRSKDRTTKGGEGDQRKKSTFMPKKINTLIKHYENGDRERKQDEYATASSRSSGLSASQLSRLSQLSADELNSWLSSPMSSTNLDKSMTEIDVLDQCVSEMISFTTDALTTDTDADTLKSGIFLNMLEHQRTSTDDVDVRKSVQEIIDKIERNESKPPVKPERTRKRERVTASPSDDDISHGVFTEVSFAGSFSSGMSVAAPEAPKEATEGEVGLPPPLPTKTSAKKGNGADIISPKAPIPSPRTKRRARKEQMLLEHKEKGMEALSILKSQSASSVPNGVASSPPPALKAATSHHDGLECLEQLCSMSRGIERESCIAFRGRPPRQAESPTVDANCDDNEDAKFCGGGDEGKVCRGFLCNMREEFPTHFFASLSHTCDRPFGEA